MSHKSSRFLHYAKLFLSLELCPRCASYNAAVHPNLKKSISFLIDGFLYLDNSEGPSGMFSFGGLSSVRAGHHHHPEDTEIAGILQLLVFCLSLFLILNSVGLEFGELHSDLSLGMSLPSVSFQTVLTCLKQDKVQTKADNCVRKLSILSFPGDFRACYSAVCSRSCLYKKAIWAV